MLKQIKDKVNDILEGFEADLKDLEEQKSHIDEKYRKMAEEEKKEIVETIKLVKAQIKSLSRMRDATESDKVEDEPDDTPVEEEKVIDTIFPENNEEPVIEVVDKQVVEEDAANDSVVVEEAVTEDKKSDEETSETVETVETAENAEWPFDNGDDKEEDGWPEFPEEWGK